MRHEKDFEWTVQWKQKVQYQVEKYLNIDHFCFKYPQYSSDVLIRHLLQHHFVFEDSQVIIKKTAEDTSWYRFNEVPNFPKYFFWEYDFDQIDWNQGYCVVIQRILERGGEDEWLELLRYYGKDIVINTIRNQIAGFYHEVCDVSSFCRYFGLEYHDILDYDYTNKRRHFLMKLNYWKLNLRNRLEHKMNRTQGKFKYLSPNFFDSIHQFDRDRQQQQAPVVLAAE